MEHHLEVFEVKTSVKTVRKRNGELADVDLSKITQRLENLAEGLDRKFVNISLVMQKVAQGMYEGVPTTELDNLAAETCAYMNIVHPHYSQLAARIAVNNLQKETKDSFAETISDLYHFVDKAGILSFY